VFSVLIFLRQRIVLCFHSLHDGMVRWMKPRSTSLLLGTITDLAKGKSELLVENALLRQQLIVLRRQVKRPACGKTDRFLLLLLVRMLRTWKQALFIVQPETLLRWHRGLFRVFWKHKSRSSSRRPKLSPETIVLIREMVANNRLWGAERIRGELIKLDIRRSQTDHSEVYEAGSPKTSPWTELEDFLAQSCGRGVGLRFPPNP
jgi:putative transposase